jgi:ABC-type transporter Mla maintaining outer membrane lipid asymmetry permease subunit MlaE
MVLFLFLSALLIAKSSWRFIDILGTQALSRWPTLLTAMVMLPEANRRFGNYLMSKAGQSSAAPAINNSDAIIFGIAAIVSLLMIIWTVVLMYRSYTVSCNVKGPKAVATFIVSLILAEVLSKVLILSLAGCFV